MARKRKKQDRKPVASPAESGNDQNLESFHAPFVTLHKDLARADRDRRRRERAEKWNLVESTRSFRTDQDSEPSPKPRSEADDFAEAVEGASRFDHDRDRVVPRSQTEVATPSEADFERIAAERPEFLDVDPEDLRALHEAQGFDVSHSEGYARGRARGVSRETVARLARGEFSVRAHLDLHGETVEDALILVDAFVRRRQLLGDRCVLIVTGKGKNSPRGHGVLRERIPEWLAKGPSSRRVLAFVSARLCDGGDGALYVLLRSTSSRKNHIVVELGGVGD